MYFKIKKTLLTKRNSALKCEIFYYQLYMFIIIFILYFKEENIICFKNFIQFKLVINIKSTSA